MTGLEILKNPTATAGEIADIVSRQCPPIIPAECDRLVCCECWIAWLTTGEPPKDNPEGTTPGAGYDLTRLRQLLREVDAYAIDQGKREGPSDKQTAPDWEKELAGLVRLLREVDDYVNGRSHDHTSQ